MKLRAKRLLAVVLAALAALTVAAAPASAATGAPAARAVGWQILVPDAPGDLIYRGSYASYFDCDANGAYGVYNGWWTAYVCQSEGGNGIWDLFAG
ncbi:curli biogenesis system outer membrane secretion channel CsgG [Streptacidiphilus sp. MAP12-33]|uniref:hypothetical protein n=1 Tax=Streptacidiphilus sp. MAP12-33 TaxID=3156266 RepID=UPI00351133B8